MSQVIQNEDGEDVEVFTAEELEAQKQEAIDAFKEENPDKSEEMEKLQADLEAAQKEKEELQAQIEEDPEKAKNFSALRKQKQEAEQKAQELQSQIDERVKTQLDEKAGEIKKDVLEGVLKDHYNDTLKSLVSDDEDLLKKVELNYKRLADEASTKEGVTKKLMDAYRLSVEEPSTGALNTAVVSSGGAAVARASTSSKKFTPEEKEFAKKLAQAGGMTLEDSDFQK